MPEHTQNPEIVVAGNKLIFPSWFNNQTATLSTNVHIYDLVTQNWNIIHTSRARWGVSTIAAGDKIFFAGGVDDDGYSATSATSIVDIYDLTTNTWTISNLSEARGYCKAAVAGNKVFFAGGLKNNQSLSSKVDIYDLQTNSWSSTLLPGGARAIVGAVASQNKVLFCGGYTVYEDPIGWGMVLTTPSSAIDVYDNSTGQWSASTMAVNKDGFAAISINGKVYLAGGTVNNAVTFHVEELDVNTMTSSNACLHQPMFSSNDNTSAVKNNMIVFFGYSPFSGIDHHKFDIYNIQTGVWSIGVFPPDLMTTNYFTAITSANNEIYAVIDDKLYKMNL
jgi:N-acetylneuraminic acid mutarotase